MAVTPESAKNETQKIEQRKLNLGIEVLGSTY